MLKKYIQILFPFLSTLILWRLDSPVFNPCGILALIPIFYYSFVKPKNLYFAFAIIMCILLDQSFGTLLYWTFIYCAAYATHGLQSFFDVSRQKSDAIFVFVGFITLTLTILTIWSSFQAWSVAVILKSIWMIPWLSVLYIVFVAIAHKMDD